jgi:hypothetical protein
MEFPLQLKDQFASKVEQFKSSVSGSASNYVRASKTGKLVLPDGSEADALECVIVTIASFNAYYDRPYSPDEVFPPACYAKSLTTDNMKPAENSPDKQSESCATCPMDEYGSSITGRGKACKNVRLLTVVPVGSSDMWTIAVPPTSIKNLDKYVNGLLSRHKVPPTAVVTEVSLDNSPGNFSYWLFDSVRPVTEEEYTAISALETEAQELVMANIDTSKYEPPKRKR